MALKQSTGKRVGMTALAWLVGFLIFFPILWTVLTSFKSEADAFAIPPKFLFFQWTTENYVEVQSRSNYLLFAWIALKLGMQPIDWFTAYPMLSVIIIVAWQWLPFASLILLTALQSLDEEQKEAAALDGAGPLSFFWYMILPHIARAVTVVILIETIFLLSVFAEILVTTSGGPGYASTNITYLVYHQALLDYDVGGASAGGIVAVILANIVAFFLVRIVGKNLDA